MLKFSEVLIMYYTKEAILVCPIWHSLMLIIALILFFTLRKKDLKTRKIPLTVITIVLVIMEIIKQAKSIYEGYSWWTFPLHFCSFFIFWPTFGLISKGKFKDFFESLTFMWSLFITVGILINPDSIYGGGINDFYHYGKISHTLLFHEFVILYFMIEILLHTVQFEYKKTWYIPIGVAFYGAIAIRCAYLLDTNYCGILHNPVTILDNIRVSLGQAWYNIIMFSFAFIFGPLTYLLATYISKKFYKLKNRKISKK